MNPAQQRFLLGPTATVAIVVCFLARGLLANVLPAELSSPNSSAAWPFSPPGDIKPPSVLHADRVTNGIDNFILARLEEKGLTLAPAAPARTLVRRLYLDLIGLPPSPAEVDAFVGDPDPKAYEKLVDKLLADLRYGERWARFCSTSPATPTRRATKGIRICQTRGATGTTSSTPSTRTSPTTNL